jgi:hypothetical protein
MAQPLFEPFASAVTGYGRGVYIPGAATPVVVTVTGDAISGGSVGSHAPLMQMHIPAGTRVIFEVEVDGSQLDYLPLAGPRGPTYEDHLNIIELFPFVVPDGQVGTITMHSELIAGGPIAKSEMAVWTFTSIPFTPSTGPTTPPTLVVDNAQVTTTEGQPVSNTGAYDLGSSGSPVTLSASIGTVTPATPQSMPGVFTWNIANPLQTDAGQVDITITDGTLSTVRSFDLVVNPPVVAAVYISGAGDDNAAGTFADPIATWKEAITRFTHGDTVLFERGYT